MSEKASEEKKETKPRRKWAWWAKTLVVLGAFLTTVLAAFFIYVAVYYPSKDVSDYLESDASLTVKDEGNISFIPSSPKAGFVFYPGAKVDEKAYVPLCHDLAKEGAYVVLIKMPFRLAFFGQNKAAGIPQAHPEVARWYLGGHSLGGAMAASFLSKGDGGYSGLALLASYSEQNLAKEALTSITIYGSEDGVLNRSKYQSDYANLPAGNIEKVIAGGNHAGFGFYGPQRKDGTASISKQQQIALTVSYLSAWMGL